MEDESGVFGASGMLRQSPRDEENKNASSSDKMPEDIDVEGTSDSETAEVDEKSILIHDEKNDEDQEDNSVEKTPPSLDHKLSTSTCDDNIVKTLKPESAHPSTQCISETCSDQTASEVQNSGSTPERIPDSVPNQELSENQKDDSTDEVIIDLSLEQKETKVSNSTLKMSLETSSGKSKKAGSSHVLLEEESNKKQENTEGNKIETDSDKSSEIINIITDDDSGPSSANEPDVGVSNVQQVAMKPAPVLSNSLKTKTTSVAIVGQSKANEEEPNKDQFDQVYQTRKSFEDVFMESLKQDKTPKQKDHEKLIHVDLADEEPENLSDNKIDDSKQVEQTDVKKQSLSNPPMKDVDSKPILDKEEAALIIVDLTDDDEEDVSKVTEVENFSSDSSSTIIDVELAAKESTEEEQAGKSQQESSTLHGREDSNKITEVSLKVDRGEGKLNCSDPTSDNKLGNEEDADPTSDTELGNKEDDNVGPWFPKGKDKMKFLTNKTSTTTEMDTLSKSKKERHQSEPNDKDNEPRRRSRKSAFLERKNLDGLEELDGVKYRRSSKTQEITRRRYWTDQSESSSKLEGEPRIRSARREGEPRIRSALRDGEPRIRSALRDGEPRIRSALRDGEPRIRSALRDGEPRIRSALRERSKSDEGRVLMGKKFRISKNGVVLQPGTKVEAMDYSKKWYTAKIINLDEGDSTVLIHFEGWNSRFDEWLEFDSDRLRPLARVSARKEVAKEVTALGGYKIGNEVLARWSDCRYYPAKILGIKTNGSYRVLFYDGIEKVVMGINVRDMPESLKSQDFFSNLEHQFRSLLNKKRRTPKEDPDGSTTSGSRPSSPVQPSQKRRHPSTSSASSASQPIKRSRLDSGKSQPSVATKVQKVTKSSALISPSPTTPQELVDLPSPTSSEASELIMSALEQGMTGKKRYREPLIFDKNSGLIRDPRRLVAPKELVIDLDHNKYKCGVPECGKAFRKESLLDYHKKYYHINKPATSTSAHTAAKNAVTRSRKRLSTSTMASGSSKIRRHESLDLTPSKIGNQQRSSAPGIMTSVYKRPLLSSTLDTPKRRPQPIKTAHVKQPPVAVSKKQPITASHQVLTPEIPELPLPAPALPSSKVSEVIPKVTERSRKVSGAAKDDKSSVSKDAAKEMSPLSPKLPAPIAEKEIKSEPADPKPSDLEVKPEVKSEIKVEPDTKDNIKDEVKGHDLPDQEVVDVMKGVISTGVSKKDKRNKTHKKHKRHKARSRDRRSREQSRSNRRRIAERAKERRLEQQRKDSLELPEQSADSVMEWTSKYLSSKGDKSLPHSPAQNADDPDTTKSMLPGVGSTTAEEGGPKEMINCICRNPEEEGFMIQCEACFGWQHGGCVGLTEHTIPKQYICNFCTHPEHLRTHARHRYNTEWFHSGSLPCLIKPKEPIEASGDLTESMQKTHQLMADMIHVTEALDTLQHKLKILKSDSHPDLKLWSYHWGLKDETSLINESCQSQQFHSSLDDTDLQLTSAENSALAESLRSNSLMDSMMQNDISIEGLSDASDKLKLAGDIRPQEGDKPDKKDVRNIFQSLRTMLTSGRYSQTPDNILEPETVNVEEISEDAGENKPQGSSSHVKSDSALVHTVPPLHSIPYKSTTSHPKCLDGKTTGNPAVCFVPDVVTDRVVKDGVARKPGKALHDGRVDNDCLSDDKPLIKYISKPKPSGVTLSASSVWTAVKATPSPVKAPTPQPTFEEDLRSVTPPSSVQAVSAKHCKTHLLNHIVCLEDELKRRMDFVEEQIEALELSFAQSTGPKDSKYISTDPLQMKKTIRTLMNDLEQVSKLVPI